jgi:hypothetical protein
MTWVPWVFSGLSTLMALILLLRTFIESSRDDTLKMHEDLAKLQERCTLLEMKINLFWRSIEQSLPDLLKKP